LSDAQVLAHGFKLTNAQELVARQAGFASWQALKTGVSTMTDQAKQTAARPILTGAEPQLFVSGIEAACQFFTARLGFTVSFTYGNPPFYAQVTRDAARLNLRHVDHPVFDNTPREREDLLSAVITVGDVKQLYLEFQSAGVPFHQALRNEPWGARTFIVRDPDGNLLLFTGGKT
jgi:catechol 2,3-dioxygenase-like lactoylglutathione lyase family enzyme